MANTSVNCQKIFCDTESEFKNRSYDSNLGSSGSEYKTNKKIFLPYSIFGNS